MRKITVTFAAALFVLGATALANAQTQTPGASSLNAQVRNATIIQKAGCGHWGRCPPGRHWVCRPGGCWCAPCW
jgi:hypothetical protein